MCYKYSSEQQGFCTFFVATDNSLCLLFYDNAVKQLYDIFCEYDNVGTTNQLANRIYDAFSLLQSISDLRLH